MKTTDKECENIRKYFDKILDHFSRNNWRLNEGVMTDILSEFNAEAKAEAEAEALREAAEKLERWCDDFDVPYFADIRSVLYTTDIHKANLKETVSSIRDRWGKDFDTADEPNPKCTWDFDGDLWASECGISWQFPEYGPKENGVNFCPKCGKPVRLADEPNKEE